MSAFTVTSDDIAVAPAAKPAATPRRRDRGRGAVQVYDLARTGAAEKNHWSKADALSALAAHSPDVLYKLRTRSRYETANNGYIGGLVRGRANDCIGTGPRLQIRFPETIFDTDFQRQQSVDPNLAKVVEDLWRTWADSIGLVDDLHLIDKSETREGEVFAVNDINPFAEPGTPQLCLRLYEADQCDDPPGNTDPNIIGGIRVDGSRRPLAYHFLFQHPGDSWLRTLVVPGMGGLGEWVSAQQVYHFLDRDRVGQVHGVPGLVSGLPLGAVMRRFTLAAVGAAELQASIPATMESENDLPDPDADNTTDSGIEEMQQIPFAHTVILVTPAGRTVKAFQPTQPAPNYREFKSEINTEAGRGINAPRGVSNGSFAEYNYSSGRLDLLPWRTSIVIRRDRFRRILLDRLFRAWYAEASAIRGYLPPGLPPLQFWRCRWQWDGFPSIDPVKDAQANQIKLTTGQTTLDDICAADGKDWEEVLEQQAREFRKREELGLPQPGAAAAQAANATAPTDNNANDNANTGDTANA